jgi:hypothetical protein
LEADSLGGLKLSVALRAGALLLGRSGADTTEMQAEDEAETGLKHS